MPHRFERAEEWVERFEGQERLAWQKPDEVVAALGLGEDATVADIGAGTGYFSIRLARAVPNGRVFAVDVEADMVRYLTERVSQERLENVTVLTGQPDNPALPEPVDVAFVCNVYHHIDDRESYFAQVRRSLAPGGRLVVVDFKKDAPADSPGPPAEHRLREADVERELAGAGFTLTASDRDLLPFHYMLTFTPTDRSEG
jgi:ubiquinone/menaquinone biosynthesis C-methylase UbiE